MNCRASFFALRSIMPFDPENPTDVSRLTRVVRKSRRKLETHRSHRRDFLKLYVGKEFSEEGARLSVPVNLVEQFVNVYKRILVPNVPSAFVSVRDASLIQSRSKLELALNHLAREIDLETTLELCVFDALLLMAVAKVGINEQTFRYAGYRHDAGQPFVDHILLDDWVHDYMAASWETVEFAGDRSFELLERVKDEFPDHADKLSATSVFRHGSDQTSRTDPVDRSSADAQDRLDDYIGLYQLWLPESKLVVLLPEDDHGIRALVLDAMPWQGPQTGPYHMLGFEKLPGSTIPLSPITTLYELANLHNALFRKAASQAKNQKTVIAARRASVKDASKVVEASDMEVVTSDDPNMLKDFRFNGADPQTLQMADLTRGLFSQYGGNLELLGGIAPQSETATQDKLLAANANQRLKSMQKRVSGFTRGLFHDLAWWLTTDPRIEMPLVKPNPGRDEGITVVFTPEDIEGDFLDYNIQINPYSAQARSPEEELQLLMSLMQNVILPFQEQYTAQGVAINFPAYLKRIGKLANINMDEFLMFMGPQGRQAGPVGRQNPPMRIAGPPTGGRPQGGESRDFQRAASMVNMLAGQQREAS